MREHNNTKYTIVSFRLTAARAVVLVRDGMALYWSRQDMGLAKYAESFADRGIATLVFDYRTFGGSDGMPRNLVDPWRYGS